MERFEHVGDIYKNPGVIPDFSVSTNPLGLPESVRRAVIDGAEDFARYPDPACRAPGLAPVKSEANFLLVKGSQSLLQRGLLLRRCDNFTGLDETCFRIDVKTREGDEMLVDAIREVLHG